MYAINENFDKDVKLLCYVEDGVSANAFCNEANNAGGMSYFYVLEVPLYENMKDYKENCPDAVRRRALAKLTSEERKVLGV